MDQEMFSLADKVSDSSPDWWRQVGGVLLTRCGTKVVGFNQHPDDEYVASFGDPRSLYTSGVRTDLSVAEHAERILIAEAARKKLGTEGSTMYLTTFPCLPCAEMMVRSGVSRLLYRDPSYGLLDAEGYLRQSGVELVAVG
jgi:dCMP deaminase